MILISPELISGVVLRQLGLPPSLSGGSAVGPTGGRSSSLGGYLVLLCWVDSVSLPVKLHVWQMRSQEMQPSLWRASSERALCVHCLRASTEEDRTSTWQASFCI